MHSLQLSVSLRIMESVIKKVQAGEIAWLPDCLTEAGI